MLLGVCGEAGEKQGKAEETEEKWWRCRGERGRSGGEAGEMPTQTPLHVRTCCWSVEREIGRGPSCPRSGCAPAARGCFLCSCPTEASRHPVTEVGFNAPFLLMGGSDGKCSLQSSAPGAVSPSYGLVCKMPPNILGSFLS